MSNPNTSDIHNCHVNSVLQDAQLSSAYGVKGKSPLSVLPNFAVTSHLLPDVMHDILEGVFPSVLKHVLNKLSLEGSVHLDSTLKTQNI